MKKKKLLTALIVGTLACLASATIFTACGGKGNSNSSNGQSEESNYSDGLAYMLSEDGTYYVLTGWGSCTDTDIVIPSTHNDLPVKEIGPNAFKDEDDITSVSIPDSITTIWMGAFNGCTDLRSVYITDVAAWCNITFQNSSANPLTEAQNLYVNKKLARALVIPDGVTTINQYAFYNCSSITSVQLPDSINDIGKNAFKGCTSLEYTQKDGLKYLGSSTNAYLYLAGTASPTVTSVTIDSNCKFFTQESFSDNTKITHVTIPENITKLPRYAFKGCTKLTTVELPNTITTIPYRAFDSCYKLQNIVIPDSVTTIDSGAFSQCDALTSITLPNGVTTIAHSLFYGCESLTSVTIPNSVTSIGDCAFDSCTHLTSVSIPHSVTSIGKNAFYGCIRLASIIIPNSVTTIGEDAFTIYLSETGLKIYCEAESQPEGWHENWRYSSSKVEWGYTGIDE